MLYTLLHFVLFENIYTSNETSNMKSVALEHSFESVCHARVFYKLIENPEIRNKHSFTNLSQEISFCFSL